MSTTLLENIVVPPTPEETPLPDTKIGAVGIAGSVFNTGDALRFSSFTISVPSSVTTPPPTPEEDAAAAAETPPPLKPCRKDAALPEFDADNGCGSPTAVKLAVGAATEAALMKTPPGFIGVVLGEG